ncbi:hypothetical protein SAMN05216232_1954 [Virgibacillus subterraneus]|uniref:Uncharacterized protein n=1 Tax=Virgibacillus subterraneus TaxID=621109 RepID=A0A1H9EA80_9BACI|nr:hypothetical protein [Virgibacillus subterraneus]SEQ22565.1 hypothetical protein SAMN05216232_1954 [Virgibacillus subterraneus]
MDKIKANIVIETLQELKSAPIGVNTDSEYKELINRYNVMFLGSKFNIINSLELAHYLKLNKDPSFSHEYLIKLLPEIKDALSLKLEGQIKLEDADKADREISNYLIHLF